MFRFNEKIIIIQFLRQMNHRVIHREHSLEFFLVEKSFDFLASLMLIVVSVGCNRDLPRTRAKNKMPVLPLSYFEDEHLLEMNS